MTISSIKKGEGKMKVLGLEMSRQAMIDVITTSGWLKTHDKKELDGKSDRSLYKIMMHWAGR